MNILRVFDNIKLPIKMSIIGLLALVGLAIPTYYYTQLSISGQTSDKIELLGIEPASEVVALKKLTAEHRGMSSRLFGGDRNVAGALSSKASEITNQISKLSDLVRASASEGDIATNELLSSLQAIESEWKRVRANVESMSVSRAASFQEHSDLIDQQDGLISDMLKTYLLSYDPAAASYHIIIANYSKIKQVAATGHCAHAAPCALLGGVHLLRPGPAHITPWRLINCARATKSCLLSPCGLARPPQLYPHPSPLSPSRPPGL